jgi:hypothetical protein
MFPEPYLNGGSGVLGWDGLQPRKIALTWLKLYA